MSESIESIVVLKVGGSVLTGRKAFHQVALFLNSRCELRPSEKLVVVVSAQKRVTDVLECQARAIIQDPPVRALDLLWSTGELRSVALLVLHLEALGISSVGLNVHETGLRLPSEPRAISTRPGFNGHHLERALTQHAVVVVPGFLVTRSDTAIVSVGRGGSDLSAVLLAIGLGASRCELVKDVPGYFENDPHKDALARHLPSLSFKDALQMADRGCELVQPGALLAAAEVHLPLVIRSIDEKAPVSVIATFPGGERQDVDQESVGVEV